LSTSRKKKTCAAAGSRGGSQKMGGDFLPNPTEKSKREVGLRTYIKNLIERQGE